MDLGEMKDRVTFKAATITKNAGGNVGGYSNILTTWAKVTQLTQSRSLSYGMVESAKNYEIVIRYRKDIDLKREMIITYRNKDLTIHSIVENDRQKEVTIIAYENA